MFCWAEQGPHGSTEIHFSDPCESIFLIRVIPWQQFQQFSNPAHMTLCECDYVTYLVTLYIAGHLVQC